MFDTSNVDDCRKMLILYGIKIESGDKIWFKKVVNGFPNNAKLLLGTEATVVDNFRMENDNVRVEEGMHCNTVFYTSDFDIERFIKSKREVKENGE